MLHGYETAVADPFADDVHWELFGQLGLPSATQVLPRFRPWLSTCATDDLEELRSQVAVVSPRRRSLCGLAVSRDDVFTVRFVLLPDFFEVGLQLRKQGDYPRRSAAMMLRLRRVDRNAVMLPIHVTLAPRAGAYLIPRRVSSWWDFWWFSTGWCVEPWARSFWARQRGRGPTNRRWPLGRAHPATGMAERVRRRHPGQRARGCEQPRYVTGAHSRSHHLGVHDIRWGRRPVGRRHFEELGFQTPSFHKSPRRDTHFQDAAEHRRHDRIEVHAGL